ncbi:MAG: DNA gyrase subunit A, partial [Alphaproteobacteria bacterium]
RNGKAIRFSTTNVRVFKSRASNGVRGMKLGKGDEVVAMAILRHVDADPAETRAYLKQAAAMRRAASGEDASVEEVIAPDDEEEGLEEAALSPERYADLGAREQFILTLSSHGYGKRSSSYEYRTSNRGGQGIIGMTLNKKTGHVVASFPVEDADQIMLVTNGGQLIRCPVDGVRVAARNTQGVMVFRTSSDEEVVSVEHLSDTSDDDEDVDAS